MAEWVVCPGCHLRHSRRPSGTCPRCNTATDGVAEPSSTEAAAEPPAERAAAGAPSLAAPAGLGNLAQSARGQQLKSVRGIMLFVGIMTVLVNGWFFSSADSDVQAEIDKEIRQLPAGMVVDPVKVQEIKQQAVRTTRLIHGGAILLGFVFLGCAAVVGSMPVPATITALSLYIAGTAIFGMISPETLRSGLVLKIFIIVTLARSVQAAIAYQKEEAAAQAT